MVPSQYSFSDAGEIPNNPNFPLLVYSGAIDCDAAGLAVAFEKMFSSNGWRNGWRNGIFAYPHYHPNAHEVLGIARGSARVRFGGETGEVLLLSAGDAVLIPAGTGHQRMECSDDLLVVGFYPPGEQVELISGNAFDPQRVRERIRAVGRPATDPVTGINGGLLDFWKAC